MEVTSTPTKNKEKLVRFGKDGPPLDASKFDERTKAALSQEKDAGNFVVDGHPESFFSFSYQKYKKRTKKFTKTKIPRIQTFPVKI